MQPLALMTDHPGWDQRDTAPVRIMESGSGTWLATWSANGLDLACLAGSEDAKPRVSEVTADMLPRTDPVLAAELSKLGSVLRVPNPSLWDAITTSILRQVVRAGQARIQYRRWCAIHGRTLDSPAGPLALTPTPEEVLGLPEAAFKEVGAAFHRTALQAAAAAYLENAHAWSRLAPPDLVTALAAVPRIGPWTASAAISDFTGDFSVYPHGDLAVRTWAKKAAPDAAWPDTEKAFAAAWAAQASTSRQLHALTLLTLAWGTHARNDGGTTPPP